MGKQRSPTATESGAPNQQRAERQISRKQSAKAAECGALSWWRAERYGGG